MNEDKNDNKNPEPKLPAPPTKDKERLKNYFENYTRTKHFQDRVLRIRTKIGIPEKGIPLPEFGSLYFIEGDASFLRIRYKDKIYSTLPAQLDSDYVELLRAVPDAYKTVNLYLFFNIYILYNTLHYEIFDEFDWGVSTVTIEKLRLEYIEMEGCCTCKLPVAEHYIKEVSGRYPVLVGISPYATQNEVVDFVKKQWSTIQKEIAWLINNNHIHYLPEQKRSLKKIRGRKTKSKMIEDLVYKNRSLNLMHLTKLINKTFKGEHLGEGEIGKIRSLAIQRREKS